MQYESKPGAGGAVLPGSVNGRADPEISVGSQAAGNRTGSAGTKVKICGITTDEDIDILNEFLPEYAGFVFYEKSKRYVTPARAGGLAKRLDTSIQKVAVCVDPDPEQVKIFRDSGMDIVQIHGHADFKACGAAGLPLWRAVNLTDQLTAEDLSLQARLAGFLVDSAAFGSGKTFDWMGKKPLVDSLRRSLTTEDERPPLFILAGGLHPDNVRDAIRLFEPDIVDVSSGVEGSHGKDRRRVAAFIKAARQGP